MMTLKNNPAVRSRAGTPHDRKINRPQPGPSSPTLLNKFLPAVARLCILAFLLSSAIAKERPYKGSARGEVIESTFLRSPDADGAPFLSEHALAEGEFTHVGHAKIELNWVVSAEFVDNILIYITEGTFLITSPNGDSMSGAFRSWQPGTATESLIEVSVEHGTGRFSSAKGLIPGTGTKQGNFFSYHLSGMLDF